MHFKSVSVLALFTATVAFALPSFAASDAYTLKKLDSSGSVGKYTSLKLRDKTSPVVAYFDSTKKQVKFAVCSNKPCDSVTLQADDTSVGMKDPGAAIEVGINSSGFPFAVYGYKNSIGTKDIVIATCSSTTCANAFPDAYTVTSFISDTTDVAVAMYKGAPLLFYKYSDEVITVRQCDKAQVGCAEKKSGLLLLDDGFTKAKDLNIAIGEDGKAILTYVVTDGTTSELRMMRCNDAACSSGTVGGLTPVTIATSTGKGITASALTLNSSGLPRIAYYSSQAKKGLIALCADKACSSSTVTTKTFYSGSPKLGTLDVVMNKSGVPVVSYAVAKESDSSKYSLKVAKCKDASCSGVTTTAVDTSGNVGLYNSVAVNADGKIVMTYFDGTNADLKYAKQK